MNKLITLFLFLVSTTTFAQVDSRKAATDLDSKMNSQGEMKEGWTKGGTLNINANHTSNDNWQGASEKYAVAINGNLNYFAYRKWKKNLWKSDLLMAYGVLRSPSTNDLFRKNDDRVNLSSLYARKIKTTLYYAAALDVMTQTAPGYDYKKVLSYDSVTNKTTYQKTSSFLTPGNIRGGVGLLWQARKNFSIYLSPATANVYTKIDKDMVNIDFNNVEIGKKIAFGLGTLTRVDYYTTINKTLTYKTRFMAFTDYLNRPFDKIDIDWNNTLMFNVTKYVGVKLDVNFRYYEGQIRRLQVLEMLGVGFTYKF